MKKHIALLVVLVSMLAACKQTEYVVREKTARIVLAKPDTYPVYNVERLVDTTHVLIVDTNGFKVFVAETETVWYCPQLGIVFKPTFKEEGKIK